MFIRFSTACGQSPIRVTRPLQLTQLDTRREDYQAADPPAMVPRLTSFMNLRIVFPHLEMD